MIMEIISKPVQNFDTGRFGYKPEAIVLHIAQGTLEGMYSWFNNSASKSSSHYGVGKDGRIWNFVEDKNTAWHAGQGWKPTWGLFKWGVKNTNLYTIGIEHEGRSGQPWTNAMRNASAWLVAKLCLQWNIPCDRLHIIGHNEINSVNRATCPGTGTHIQEDITNSARVFYDQWKPKPKPQPKPADNLYKVFKAGKLLKSFPEEDAAFNLFVEVDADRITFNNKDLTITFAAMANKLQTDIENLQITIKKLQETIDKQSEEYENLQDINEQLRTENEKLNKSSTSFTDFLRQIYNKLFKRQ